MENKDIEKSVESVEKESTEFLNKAGLEELIKSNQIEFTINEQKFRVRRPSFEQKQKASLARTRKFIELLKDPDNLLEKDLLALYEQRGLKITDLDSQVSALQTKKDDYSLKLGEALTKDTSKDDLEILRNEIVSLTKEQNRLYMQKSILLDPSIESQINVFIYTYLASLITEKLSSPVGSEPTYVTAWSSYEDFIKEESKLVNEVIWYASLVSKNELPYME